MYLQCICSSFRILPDVHLHLLMFRSILELIRHSLWGTARYQPLPALWLCLSVTNFPAWPPFPFCTFLPAHFSRYPKILCAISKNFFVIIWISLSIYYKTWMYFLFVRWDMKTFYVPGILCFAHLFFIYAKYSSIPVLNSSSVCPASCAAMFKVRKPFFTNS